MSHKRMIKTIFTISFLFLLVIGNDRLIIPVTGENASVNINLESSSGSTLYLDEEVALSIADQPNNNIGYVSNIPGVITRFRQAEKQGSIGLIAHNYLAGEKFFNLGVGDFLTLASNNEKTNQRYEIIEIKEFQALDPRSIHSKFRNLDTEEIISAHNLSQSIYGLEDHLILQTCIENDGDTEWGRLFVIAKPIA